MVVFKIINWCSCREMLFDNTWQNLSILPFVVLVFDENESYRKRGGGVFLKLDFAQHRIGQNNIAVAEESHFRKPVESGSAAGNNAGMFADNGGFSGVCRVVSGFNLHGGGLTVNPVVIMHEQHKCGDNYKEDQSCPQEFQKFLSLRWR
jgi:hypothetical protein